MAVNAIDNDIIYVSGIKYTHTTDDSSDWDSVSNDTYFYDLDTKLPYYKNGDGNVLYVFQDSSSGSSIYTDDDTIGSTRELTITDTLVFKQNDGNNLFTLNTNGIVTIQNGGNTYGKWFTNGDVALGGDTIIGVQAGICLHRNTLIKGEGNGSSDNCFQVLDSGNNGLFKVFGDGTTIISGTSKIGSETISIQGSTFIKGEGTSTGTTLALYDNDTTPNKTWEWLDNGNVNIGQDSILNLDTYKLEFKDSTNANSLLILDDNTRATISNTIGGVFMQYAGSSTTGKLSVISDSVIVNAEKFETRNQAGSHTALDINNNSTNGKISINNGVGTQMEWGSNKVGIVGSSTKIIRNNIIRAYFEDTFTIFGSDNITTIAGEDISLQGDVLMNANVNMSNLPTSNSGLSAGDLWDDNGSVRIGTSDSNGGSGTKVLVKGAMGANQTADNTIPVVEFVTTGTPTGGAFDINSEWDNTNHKFTVGASGAGTYFVQAQIFLTNGTGWSTLYLYKNGSIYSSFGGNGTDTTNTWDNLDGTIAIDLVVGDYIDIRAFSSVNGTISFSQWPTRQSFSITKVSAVAPAAGTDVNALHTNISNEINSVTEKTDPSNTDKVLIEESDGTKKSQSRKNFKRLVVSTTTTSSSLTPSIDDEEAYVLTALSDNLTINAPTGTPYDFQTLWFRITDNGVSRTISTNALFVDYTGNFPTSTTPNKQLIFASQWDGSNWNILAWKTQP